MSSPHPTDEQILTALEKSGFLFEQEIATILEGNGFHVETSWSYLDLDTKKSREIDLRAVKTYLHNEEHKIQIFAEILVECKDSSSPFVFLERQKNKRETTTFHPKEYIFPRKTYRKELSANSFREIPAFTHLGLAPSHYYFKYPNKATQFSKIVRKGSDWVANHEGIYDSLFLPIAKAVDASLKSLPGSRNTGEWRIVWLIFPVVVLRDHLMTLTMDGEDKSLTEKGRVTFVRNLDSDTLKGDYLVDFVTSHYLQNYLDNDVGQFVSAIADLSISSPELIRGDKV
ncbi:hypothetical protein [Pseudomonas sp. GM60]|uniref:hypothetical protein n=1 Tax=Pseudomonas sp. GM60 TaxID=1144334 RepID=UPI0002706E62|nr:hypothetical protein [Pseudomonas sp. GM60]EJM80472.1 hypothetical protein PMI32_03592 [Pseudomonas sp. GM60]